MAMKRAFTLVEIVMVVVVTGILALGTFKALKALFIRSIKAQTVTEFSLNGQAVLDQLGIFLYNRVPASVIGYDPSDGSVRPLASILSSMPVLEWLGTAEEALTSRDYSGFVDMNRSSPSANTLFSPDTVGSRVDERERARFGRNDDVFSEDLVRLAFAGTFDEGDTASGGTENAFGWHGSGSEALFPIEIRDTGEILLGSDPAYIYEKYYLVDTAYGVARGEDIDRSAECIVNLPTEVTEETLLLFYDYRPWKGESFCADPNGKRAGKVTILAERVDGFRAEYVNRTIRLSVEMLRPVGGTSPVRISKQKVVF